MNTIEKSESGVSVIICCYNSAHRIEATLNALKQQDMTHAWEVILIDNRCTDDTVAVATKCWGDFHIPLRIDTELTPGVSRARRKGILISKYEYVLFCDDDNHFFPDYISRTFQIFETKQDCMMCGGQGIALPEVTPPDWFKLYFESYATGKQWPESGWCFTLYNAGMAVRKSKFLELTEAGFKFYLTSRLGKALTSGEDSELCIAFRMAGWKIWYDDDLKFYHFIPEGRLKWNYLVRLHEGFSYSYVTIKLYEEALDPVQNKFKPLKEFLYYSAILVKYYPKFKKAKEGDKIILHYGGWKVLALTLFQFLTSGNEKRRELAILNSKLQKFRNVD